MPVVWMARLTMKITMFAAEHDYDPGFTVVFVATNTGGTISIREKDLVLSSSRELSAYEWQRLEQEIQFDDVKKSVRLFMDEFAFDEQQKRGWRDRGVTYKRGQVV
jgi:hypothetical protein